MVKSINGMKKYGVETSNGSVRRLTNVFANNINEASLKAMNSDYYIISGIRESEITAQDVLDHIKNRLCDYELLEVAGDVVTATEAIKKLVLEVQ